MEFPVTLQKIQDKNDIFCEKNKPSKKLEELTKSDYNHISFLYLNNQDVLLEGVLCIKHDETNYQPVYFIELVEMYGFKVERLFHEPVKGEDINTYGNKVLSMRGTFFVLRLGDNPKSKKTMKSNLNLVYQKDNLDLTWDEHIRKWIIKFGHKNKNMWMVFDTNPIMSFQLYHK